MDADQGESIHFWQTPPLAGVELLSARYIDHRFAPHVHDGYVIGMIMAGAQRYRYRGAEHLAGSGTLVLINPDELHTGHKGTEDGWLYRAFYPDSGQMTSLLAELELPTHHLPAFGATLYRDQDLVNGFCQLHRLLESPASALQQQTVWRELVLSLLQRHAAVPDAGKPGKEHRAVSLAKELLHSQLAAPPSLEALATAVNLSPFHFARVFRRATGMPPHTWLMQQRIARARALLQSGCLPLEVAMQLGFADQSHLSRQFKQVYGVGPGAYRSAKRGLEA
ncbi:MULTISPECIES: AraC family transcriptional regulator [Pseudomonas]|jgi:AraC-like DNA-binding protein|uniref:AraC-type DNA-binding protein n=2 Tax=Pseudomonas TaxID=286 RepID=A0A231GBA4_PSEJE|nr:MULTISPECIES: AraC family transcriptional regulator [Pseudomonas]MBV7488339.1 AraC family transcriptional regulator [Pseudomonas sp. PDM30]OOQ42554.1 AraC family transcriptional regulator [Pseudomonas fluorescens]OXR33888.1 AraC family transcriptional regulator [Pseudomonas jessenii]SEB50426.1 AraC-type DNA-binding protein [Pseudomonas jessenii]VVP89619.1 HTH-type transcriptional activator RhaR [Pseudomonas fluorescens]